MKEANNCVCSICGIRKSQTAISKNNKTYYKRYCRTCQRNPGLGDKAKQTHCSVCLGKFHPVCLDVDHIDGNNSNNSYNNLQVICANCHRLKSLMCHDFSTFKKD